MSEGPENEVSPNDVAENGVSENRASPYGPLASDKKPVGVHRPPTRIERLRAWLERLPRVRLYVALLLVVWLSLTLLISTDISSPVSGVSTPWTRFLLSTSVDMNLLRMTLASMAWCSLDCVLHRSDHDTRQLLLD